MEKDMLRRFCESTSMVQIDLAGPSNRFGTSQDLQKSFENIDRV